MCEFVLKKQGINYVEKVCQKHSDLHRPGIKNPTRTIAANHLRSMLFDQMRRQSKVFLTHVESATATETKLFGNSCTVKRNSQIVQSNYLI